MTVRSTAIRSRQERDELVEKFLPLVRYVVARLPVTMPQSLDREDFFSVGVMGLMQAASTYDPARGASFKTFAYTAIRGAILDEIRRHDPVPRNRRDRLRKMDRATDDLRAQLGRAPTLEELAEYLGLSAIELDDDLLALHTCRTLSLDDAPAAADGRRQSLGQSMVGGGASLDPVDAVLKADLVKQLSEAIAKLPDVDRHVVMLYHFEGLFLKEIGEIMGVSESRVSQILSRATTRLRLRLRDPEEVEENA